MTHTVTQHTQRFALLAAALAAVLLAAPAAQAFTFERNAPGDTSGTNYFDPTAGLTAPKEVAPGFDSHDKGAVYRQDGLSVHMNGGSFQSFDQRYNPNNLFDPFAREGR